ncbi:hypothetical protein INT45_007675 [Circinella minor]|uniref:PAS domain-containing protein n=1 Tax=Circinella minor TaxID=1195481 RepID=A0A8H7RUP4_9FUNG|nr:hypothetical protein INT45_007675 [Circinella minor]
MDSLFNTASFNSQCYESNNIPPPTDRLHYYSGYLAGLITNEPSAGISLSTSTLLPNNNNNIKEIIPEQQQQQQQQQHKSKQSVTQISKSISTDPLLNLPVTTGMTATTKEDSSIGNERYSGMYTSTGFDILSVLVRVVNRPNPQINLGPVDLSSSIVVVDARQYDFPIIYASPMFEHLTGYSSREIMGRNCRFLQAPDGGVAMGSKRRYTDNNTVYHIRTHLFQGKESQASIINYKKSGQPFVNLLTVIPVSYEVDEEISYFVGFQVDLVEQPNLIMQNMKGNGTYMVNYQNLFIPPVIPSLSNSHGSQEQEAGQIVPVKEWVRPSSAKHRSTSNALVPESTEEPMSIETLISEANRDSGKYKRSWEELLLKEYPDFMHVLTIKGIFLYCSDSISSILGYKPNEIEGKSISTICHPSDITTVLRELKQSSNGPSERVNIIYRIRRKNGSYMWMECMGRLHNEDGRGRKYVVLSGRERPAYQLTAHAASVGRTIRGNSTAVTPLLGEQISAVATTTSASEIGNEEIEKKNNTRNNDSHKQNTDDDISSDRSNTNIADNNNNNVSDSNNKKLTISTATDDHEVWCKLSTDGLILYASWTCANILGFTPNDIVGVSMYQFLKSCRTTDLTRSLAETTEGKIVHLQHTLLNNAGIEISVASTFYPDGSTIHPFKQPSFILMNIRMAPIDTQNDNQEPILISLDPDVKKSGLSTQTEQHNLNTEGDKIHHNQEEEKSNENVAKMISTEKMIKELDVKHKSNWQYELHQLRINNNKLRGYLSDALKKKKELCKATADIICQSCLRRLADPQELIEYESQDQPLFCNTCILR